MTQAAATRVLATPGRLVLGALLGLQAFAIVAQLLDLGPARVVASAMVVALVPGCLILLIVPPSRPAYFLPFAVGISLLYAFALGLVASFALPSLGVTRPFDGLPLSVAFYAPLAVLDLSAAVVVSRRRAFVVLDEEWEKAPVTEILVGAVLVALACCGGLAYERFGWTVPQIVFLAALCSTLLVFGLRARSNAATAVMLYAAALALCLHRALVSPYLLGWDVHNETFIATGVLERGSWDPGYAGLTNSTLSISMLGPIFSRLTGLGIDQVFRLVYPAIYALMPAILVAAYRNVLAPRWATFAAIFFLSYSVFFTEMLALCRQIVAEIFFGLLLLVVLSPGISRLRASILLILFGAGITLSHYGLAYLGIGILGVGLVITSLRLFSSTRSNLTWTALLFFVVFTIAWYLFTSQSASFLKAAQALTKIASTDIFATGGRDSLALKGIGIGLSTHVPPIVYVGRFVFYGSQLLVLSGALALLRKSPVFKPGTAYPGLALAGLALLGLSLGLPFFASQLNFTRVYHISLIVVAPLFAGGAEWLRTVGVATARRRGRPVRVPAGILATVFVTAFLVFNTSLAYALVPGSPLPVTLSTDNTETRTILLHPDEIAAAHWFAQAGTAEGGTNISDKYGCIMRLQSVTHVDQNGCAPRLDSSHPTIPSLSLIYERRDIIIADNIYLDTTNEATAFSNAPASTLVEHASVVFDAGGARVLRQP